MQLTFNDHCIEMIYTINNAEKAANTYTVKALNYFNETAHIKYHRDNNKIQLSLNPVTRLYMKKVIVTLKASHNDVACFANGYQSWTYTGVFTKTSKKRKPWPKFVLANQENISNPPKGKAGIVQSDMVFVCGDSNSQSSVLFGQLPLHKDFHQFVSYEFNYRNSGLSIIWDIDCYIDAGEEYILDVVCMLEGDAWKILQGYAEIVSQELSPTFNKAMRKGWCSWYYYYNAITKEEIIANAKYAKEHSIPFDFIQIDDGYQTTIGEWTIVKNSFTASMRYIADTIKDFGFTPGIWYSPFIVSKYSRIFKEHQSWILKDEKGKPVIAGYNPAWGGYYYTVDVTQPAVLSWIEDTINTLLYEWGYEYLKLDFMYAAALPGKRFGSGLSRYEALANAVKRIRKASGNAFLLGCGMPLQSGIGYVDAMRIGPDVAPQWGRTFFDVLFNSDSGISTRSAIRSSIFRSFMHNRFWVNDPDCLMIRSNKTKLNEQERQTLFNVINVLGGMLVVSDKLTEYTTDELNTLLHAIALFDNAKDGDIYCSNILSDESPDNVFNCNGYALFVNLNDIEKTNVLDVENLKINGTTITISDDLGNRLSDKELQLTLAPHSSKLFTFSK